MKCPVFKVPRANLDKIVRIGISDELQRESERYHLLAGQEALKAVLNPEAHGDRKVRDHLLRAETFKAAAAIVAGGGK